MTYFLRNISNFFLDSLRTLASITQWLWSPLPVLQQAGFGDIAPIALLTFTSFVAIFIAHIWKLVKIW